jgi:predicted AlkP superfamily pyrophosphatase or phosphodiesterase
MRKILAVLFIAGLIWLIMMPLKKKQPRLVVYISIDQMRYDYLDRFRPHFSAGGFNFIRDYGTSFSESRYGHICTMTAPGHAALGTSCYGGKSGIVGNAWFDKDAQRSVYCVDDLEMAMADPESDNVKSPSQLLVSTLGDEMKNHFAGSRVYSVSGKDRAAILMVGKQADAAFWLNKNNGHFGTSAFYLDELPDWVETFNNSSVKDSYFTKIWSKLLDESAYSQCSEDDFPHEATPGEMGRVFPHPVNAGLDAPGKDYYRNLLNTPFGDEYTLEFARELIDTENLGRNSDPDLLCVSLSATDYIGHSYGPDSHEMMDNMVRLDRNLDRFFQYLGREVGLDNLLIILSADHGVAPLPEYSAQLGKDAGRINPDEVFDTAENRMRAVFGNPPKDQNWIAGTFNANIYINPLFWERFPKAEPATVQSILKEALENVEGIARVITKNELMTASESDSIAMTFKKAFHPERSGELVLVQKQYWIFSYSATSRTGTTHGSPYSYDNHVPMIIYGQDISRENRSDAVGPADIAITVGELFGFTMPGDRDGISRKEMLAPAEY